MGARRLLPTEESMSAQLKVIREAQRDQGESLQEVRMGQVSDRSRSKETDAAMLRELQALNATLLRLIEIVSRR